MRRTPRDRPRRRLFACPHCGADVRAGAVACPQCGSDEDTDWSDDASKWAGDIPTGYGVDDEFDYEDFIQREFSSNKNRILGLPAWVFILAVGMLVLGALIVLVLSGD